MTTPNHRQHRIEVVEGFALDDFPLGSRTKLRLSMVGNGLGGLISVPVVVIRGTEPGPTVGLTAAVHGNELNGVRVIQKVIAQVQPEQLRGALVCVPVVNVPGYLNNTRQFNDGADLNRTMPGKLGGTNAQAYAHRFVSRVVTQLDYLIDLHTASFGRVNTLYVRADLEDPDARWMARCQQPEIILHNTAGDGTLRAAAMDLGVKSITVEVGNPNAFQTEMIHDGTHGVLNVLSRLKMIDADERSPTREPILCMRSHWMYTQVGGVLSVLPALGARLRAGDLVARVHDIFGERLAEYHAREDGVVIGRSTHPVNQTGSRILHLGIEGSLSSLE